MKLSYDMIIVYAMKGEHSEEHKVRIGGWTIWTLAEHG